MITFLTVPPKWAAAFSRERNTPVHSITTSTPSEDQSNFAGSRSQNTRVFLPSTTKYSPSTDTSQLKLP